MPGIVTLGDLSNGHAGFPSRPNITASSTVFVEGRGVHTVGDVWTVHCDGDSCHGATSASGSSALFVGGRQVMRIGDPISCGDTCMTGVARFDVGR